MKFGPSLLCLEANGSRYFIARNVADDSLYLVEEDGAAVALTA